MLPGSDQLALFIGLRYSFSRQRNRFIGVVSMVSLLGMAIGVASLITVLSVMNGFAGELRSRILSLVAHAEVRAVSGDIDDWQALLGRLAEQPGLEGIAPFVETKALLASRRQVRGAQLIAVAVDREASVSRVLEHITSGKFDDLKNQPYGIVLGSLLARSLGVSTGDSLEITVPKLTMTPLGMFPRSKRFTVVGIFEVGAQLDGSHAYISLRSGQKLLSMPERVHGLRLHFSDLYQSASATAVIAEKLGTDYRVRSWQQTQRSLFSAVRMEKTMIAVLLLSVVAVAAFNIVSTLTMAITDKRGDIAVLRTMGIRASRVMAIFVAQGLVLASAGIALGICAGVLLALNISDVSLFFERLLGVKLFNPDVYFISNLPSELQWPDVAAIALSALVLSLLATLLPAWRATRIAPAEVLRYE